MVRRYRRAVNREAYVETACLERLALSVETWSNIARTCHRIPVLAREERSPARSLLRSTSPRNRSPSRIGASRCTGSAESSTIRCTSGRTPGTGSTVSGGSTESCTRRRLRRVLSSKPASATGPGVASSSCPSFRRGSSRGSPRQVPCGLSIWRGPGSHSWEWIIAWRPATTGLRSAGRAPSGCIRMALMDLVLLAVQSLPALRCSIRPGRSQAFYDRLRRPR